MPIRALLRKIQKNPADQTAGLQDHIGRHVVISAPIINGSGEVQIDEKPVRAISDDDLPEGSRVTIIAAEGRALRVRRR